MNSQCCQPVILFVTAYYYRGSTHALYKSRKFKPTKQSIFSPETTVNTLVDILSDLFSLTHGHFKNKYDDPVYMVFELAFC